MKAGYSDEVPYLLYILVFADNVWLIGKSPLDLEEMTKFWQDRMASLGWTVPSDGLSQPPLKDNVYFSIKLGDIV